MTLLDELFRLRDEQRAHQARAPSVVDGESVEWEVNRQGKMKWLLHPAQPDRLHQSLLVYVQEIPPGSRSGRQRHQGGIIHFIIQGRGHTLVNGVRHDWEAGDTVALPVLPEGVDYQHFNDDPEKPVFFLANQPNLVASLGVDLGASFEQLEDAPEYATPGDR